MYKQTWKGLDPGLVVGKPLCILHLVPIISHLGQNHATRNSHPSILVPPIWFIPWQPCWNYKSHLMKLKTSQWFPIGLKIKPNTSEPKPLLLLTSLWTLILVTLLTFIGSHFGLIPFLQTVLSFPTSPPFPTPPTQPSLSWRLQWHFLRSPSFTSKQKWVWALLCNMHWF